ncbi:hypothetical protein [Polluticaenibacter yanchengensis]|uniref:Lipocalin-like domain-containing protein n=1 Tax=Polluticaenibacter yanchengensis TaxID=3014562 RepID=A0ABT4UHB5_9BACT|nr:hypothetical protein [Chitinophagaceae bacterium LY-5]
MTKFLVLFICFCTSALSSFAQDLKGIWRGYFTSNGTVFYNTSNSKFEIQIDDSKKAINGKKPVYGVSYSYTANKSFFGKATVSGIWTPKGANLLLEEKTMLEYRNTTLEEIAVFNCILEYFKENGKEYLIGTYTSKNYLTGAPAGNGRIKLERVLSSDFEKEPFLQPNASKLKPGAESFATNKKTPAAPLNKSSKIVEAPVKADKADPQDDIKPDFKKPEELKLEVPVELPQNVTKRKNELVDVIETSVSEVFISFYDNAEVDGDTISVYNNNKLIVDKKGLSTKPIKVKLELNEANPEINVIMYAENMGKIPPNTALMIVEYGSQRKMINLTSTEQKNAMIRFRYKRPDK